MCIVPSMRPSLYNCTVMEWGGANLEVVTEHSGPRRGIGNTGNHCIWAWIPLFSQTVRITFPPKQRWLSLFRCLRRGMGERTALLWYWWPAEQMSTSATVCSVQWAAGSPFTPLPWVPLLPVNWRNYHILQVKASQEGVFQSMPWKLNIQSSAMKPRLRVFIGGKNGKDFF